MLDLQDRGLIVCQDCGTLIEEEMAGECCHNVPSTPIHEIQSEVHKLATVRITGAVEACDWTALHRLAEQLAELASRGLYHASLERAKSIGIGGHTEREPR